MSESSTTGQPAAISGIEAMRGVGAGQANGFWADAWDRVVARFGARMALGWIGTVAFFAVFAPVLASAHPPDAPSPGRPFSRVNLLNIVHNIQPYHAVIWSARKLMLVTFRKSECTV